MGKMFLTIFIRILRAWQTRNKLVAFFFHSHGKYTETSVLLDDTGSAYQVTVHLSGSYLFPQITVSEYLPDTGRILHQVSFTASFFTFRSKLDQALKRISQWMTENKAKRLTQEDEMKLVKKMYEQATIVSPPN